MHQGAIHGAVVFCPLLLNVDEGPLPSAELEVLEAGQQELVLLAIDHPIRTQVTPAGTLLSSTETT